MKSIIMNTLIVTTILSTASLYAEEPVAGGVALSHVEINTAIIATGWSAKKLLGSDVVNDASKKIGKIHDVIMSANGEGITVANIIILDVGGFLGMAKKHIALPVNVFKSQANGKGLLLPDSTKETLKELPAFKYSK